MDNQNEGEIGKDSGSWRGSNRIASLEIDTLGEEEAKDHDQHKIEEEDLNLKKPAWRNFFSFVGPGFLVASAYLDPGNLETDLQGGSAHQYELLWVILIGLIFAQIIQSLAANLGVTTGKHLAEHCKDEYPKNIKYCLWLLAELAVIAADIPEVVGSAFALNILFHIPVWSGVLLTGLTTLLLLALQRYGVRKLELFISVMVFVLAGCFFGELGYVKPPASDVLKGLFIPKLKGNGATADAIAIWGTIVVPHNLFLHSALVLSRKVPQSVKGINDACRYFFMESAFAVFMALLINVSMLSVTAAVCSSKNLSTEDANRCGNLTLDSAAFLLRNVLGKWSSTVYGVALLTSGQSTSITGTYAGQFIMHGFLNIKMRPWLRNLMTRSVAIVPSLIVASIGGPTAGGQLIIIASMIMGFELPFSLIPLLKFSSGRTKMGPHKNSIYIIVIAWLLGACFIGINVYFLSTAFVGWLIDNSLPKVANVFIGIIVFPFMAIYILAIIYLTIRKDKVVTFVDTIPHLESSTQTQMEKGAFSGAADDHGMDEVPYREDLADIPLPE
ncbi:metal transporter Nramp7.2-like [Tasmannia lanceolata]|uniref:metal transporter Nramp7.2-like n=1 Tax=Tasmannia lanceolata TaxID=3420 RepID=UPI0040637123